MFDILNINYLYIAVSYHYLPYYQKEATVLIGAIRHLELHVFYQLQCYVGAAIILTANLFGVSLGI